MDEIRYGIIGTGGAARLHVKWLARAAGATLHACFDAVPERARAFAAEHGVAHVAPSLDGLFEMVDAVAVAAPDAYHAELTLRALSAGRHVLCEKPLTTTLDDARHVARAAREAQQSRGIISMINFSKRNAPALQAAIGLAREGQLGEVRHFSAAYFQSWLVDRRWGSWTDPALLWRLCKSSGCGGALFDLGVHALDFATAVAGEAARVRCTLRTFPKVLDGATHTSWNGAPLDQDDTAVIEVETTGGALGVIQVTRWAMGRSNHERLEVFGTGGALSFDLGRSEDQLDVSVGPAAQQGEWSARTCERGPNVHQVFFDAIRTCRPAQPDLARGAQIQSCLHACQRSAESGRWESVEPWDL